jgi:subtilisin family serine protease
MSIDYAAKEAIDYAVNNGVLMIAAAGNEGKEIEKGSLAASDDILTVGAVNNDNKLSAWTNTGEEVDLYAPWDIIGNGQGTSFSAAFVSGVAALILEEDPELTPSGILEKLTGIFSGLDVNGEDEKTADKLDEKVVEENMSKNEMIRKSMEQFSGYDMEKNEGFVGKN